MREAALGSAWEAAAPHSPANPSPRLECRCGGKCSPHFRAAFPLQHVAQDRPNRGVVLDDQHALAGLATTMGLKHAAQMVAIERLGKVIGRTKREALLLL